MKEVILGKGLDGIPFGIDQEELKSILGEPDDVELLSENGEDVFAEVYHYDDLELSASFELFDGGVLSSLSLSGLDTRLNGKEIIGKDKVEAIKITGEMHLGPVGIDDDPENECLSFEDSGINLWLEDGIVIEVQWTPIWDEDGNVIWPD